MKKRHGIILAFLALLAVYCLAEFKVSLNPYVSFAEARTTHATVQVKGTLIKETEAITYQNQELKFFLLDEQGNQVLVSYHGVKPANFEQADSLVVVGKQTGGEFAAEKLLIKCPSKYEKKGN